MAENFQCMICGAPATVHLTRIFDGKVHKMHFCEKCAGTSGAPEDVLLKFTDLLKKTLEKGGKSPDSADAPGTDAETRKAKKICPECGTTNVDFEEKHLLGCEHCYEIFAEELAGFLPRFQPRGTEYRGERGNAPAGTPESASAAEKSRERRKTPDELRRALKNAVAKENYALAAKLRDELHAAEKSAGTENSPKKTARKSAGKKSGSSGGNAAGKGENAQ